MDNLLTQYIDEPIDLSENKGRRHRVEDTMLAYPWNRSRKRDPYEESIITDSYKTYRGVKLYQRECKLHPNEMIHATLNDYLGYLFKWELDNGI